MSITATRPGRLPHTLSACSGTRLCARCGIRFRITPHRDNPDECRDCRDLNLPIADPNIFPPCTVCDTPMRTRRTPLSDAPGTRVHAAKGVCDACYRAAIRKNAA